MFHIVLYQPEIPPNTGNIIRLCANTGSHLHLIQPLGFAMDDKKLRRAGLDYSEWADVALYDSWPEFIKQAQPACLYACSTKASRHYHDVAFQAGDYLLFGPETRGLPEELLHELGPQHCLRLPMLPHSRSMNLSNAVSVFLYEAWRQLDFRGGG
ncbi:MAG: tRNA (uridine(34)/cytosine(34)/5-carboxymethylaminomethyluridine(34)-2'-O)-methyltransferase TrmL [Chromatiales bacterium]